MAARQNEHIINIHSTYMYIHKTQEAQLPQRGRLILKILKTAAVMHNCMNKNSSWDEIERELFTMTSYM